MAAKGYDAELARYQELTPRSRALFEEGKRYLPGADTRTSIFWKPYPIFLDHGSGCRVVDVDGVERIDYVNNMTTLVLGHSHPAIVEALQRQAEKGVSFGAPSEPQIRLAQLLCQRVPSLELVRFTNSGTEATLNCVRAARAFTGRTKLAKVEGGYHGTHDAVSVSVRVDPKSAGNARHPDRVPEYPNMPTQVVESVVVLPFNDVEASQELLLKHAEDLACVIVEPVMGGSGMIPALPEYLQMLRQVTQRIGALLIFDEVISLRVAPGGAQQHYGITPDMTAMGKIIGGGLPVGAFGGKREIMELYDPTKGPKLNHAGTFQGNPMTMVAGIATLENLTPQVYRHLDSLADRLKQGVRAICDEMDVPVQVTGIGSIFGIHFTDKPVLNWRDTALSDQRLKQQVFWGLMNEGMFVAPRLIGCTSLPMTEADVDSYLEALRRVLARR